MTSIFRELELEVSADLVRDCPGLAMDVGGSVAKIVYRHKDDYDAVINNKDAKTGKLRLLSCVRTGLDEAIAKVKSEAYITRDGDKATEIFTCGIGCSQYGVKINRMLNVKLSNVMEMDCFIKAFVYLSRHYSCRTLLQPACSEEITQIWEETEKLFSAFQKFKDVTSMEMKLENAENSLNKPDEVDDQDRDTELSVAESFGENMWPCQLLMLGSAFAFMNIRADGTFEANDGSHRGGRTLLGLASIILGADSYDEIIDLAEKGNHFEVDMSQQAFHQETEAKEELDNDVYRKFFNKDDNPESIIFAFGHAVSKRASDFKREDLAAALVNLSVNDMVQTAMRSATDSKVKRVFLCGSFANRIYMRKEITKEWSRQLFAMSVMKPEKPKPKLHFMSAGSHLGALGALINNTENFIGRDGIAVPKTDSEKQEGQKD